MLQRAATMAAKHCDGAVPEPEPAVEGGGDDGPYAFTERDRELLAHARGLAAPLRAHFGAWRRSVSRRADAIVTRRVVASATAPP
jgi:hypothetical protein